MGKKKLRIKTYTNDPHYADKGSHGIRHDFNQIKRQLDKYNRKQARTGKHVYLDLYEAEMKNLG